MILLALLLIYQEQYQLFMDVDYLCLGIRGEPFWKSLFLPKRKLEWVPSLLGTELQTDFFFFLLPAIFSQHLTI